MNSYKRQIDNIVITVDFRTELLGIMSCHTIKPLGNKFIYDNVIEVFRKYLNLIDIK